MSFSRTPSITALITFGALAIIVAFGLTLRYQAFSHSVVPQYPHGDAAKYFLYAYNLKNFGVYGNPGMTLVPATADADIVSEKIRPDALVTPGFPLYLSLFLSGDFDKSQTDAARLGQVVLSTLTILLAYAAFAPTGRLYGLGVAALTALSPHLINMNLFLLTETLFCFLVITLVWIVSRTTTSSKPLFFLLIGLVLASATLTRPWIQGYLFVLMAYLYFSKLRIPIGKTLLVFVGAAIVTAPWLIRNTLVFGSAADPTLSVTSIHHGMYPNMMYEGQSDSLGSAYDSDPMTPELGKSLGVTLAELKRRAAAQPYKYISWYLVGKTRSVLSWKIIAGADDIFVYHVENSPYFELPKFYLSRYYMEKIHGVLMLLALVGVAIVWTPRRLQRLSDSKLFFLRAASLLIIYFLFMHIIGAPYPRYSIPMRPIFYAMSLYPIFFLLRLSVIRTLFNKNPQSIDKG